MKFLFTILILLTGFSRDQTLTNDHLEVFEGEWSGSLTYLNYGDDKTKVTLPMDAEITFSDKGLAFKHMFKEPNGAIETRTTKFRLRKDKIFFNGSWEFKSGQFKDLKNWTLELEGKGKDNNRASAFTKTIEVSSNRIVVTKRVRYEGTDHYFVRNKHVYEK